MKIFLWTVMSIFLAIWSAGCWLAHAVIDVSGNWMSGNADMMAGDPQTVEWLSRLGRSLAGIGETVVFLTWAVGVLVMVAIPWLLGKLIDHDRSWRAERAQRLEAERAAAAGAVPRIP